MINCIGCILNIVSKKTNKYSTRIPNLVKHPVQSRHVATTYMNEYNYCIILNFFSDIMELDRANKENMLLLQFVCYKC